MLPNHLLVVKSKNKRPRTIPMTPRVRVELLSVIQDRIQGPVFSSARTGINLVEIKKGFKRACELAEILYGQSTPGGLTFHDLRHTFATRLAERGVSETARMALLGQSSTKMVRRYSHATPEALVKGYPHRGLVRVEREADVVEIDEGALPIWCLRLHQLIPSQLNIADERSSSPTCHGLRGSSTVAPRTCSRVTATSPV